MGLVSPDDDWRVSDWLWERIEPLLPPPRLLSHDARRQLQALRVGCAPCVREGTTVQVTCTWAGTLGIELTCG